MPASARIGLFLELSTSFERRIVRGVATYARSRNWELLSQSWGDISPSELRRTPLDGLLIAATRPSLLVSAAEWNVPTVNVANTLPDVDLPSVYGDSHAIGQLAAGHFIERGFRQFGFLGHAGVRYSEQRESGFREALGAYGPECSAWYTPLDWSGRWRRERDQLDGWLSQLPQPCAIFAANDIPARRVLQACRRLRIHVPDQVAVLGVGDLELINQVVPVPLSTVLQPAETIGYEAAQLLDQLTRGGSPASPVLVPPTGIVVRQSSESFAVDDPDLDKALKYMRANLAQGLRVHHVAEHLSVSRRWLELLFRRHLGRSPRTEIRRLQMETARRLLIETDWPLESIARRCGLKSGERLNAVFRQVEGIPPGQFRKRFPGVHVET
ncbi:MAG: substrate-binding domain-containing protein [Candidatus Eremiobacterota bacterium]